MVLCYDYGHDHDYDYDYDYGEEKMSRSGAITKNLRSNCASGGLAWCFVMIIFMMEFIFSQVGTNLFNTGPLMKKQSFALPPLGAQAARCYLEASEPLNENLNPIDSRWQAKTENQHT